MSGIVWTSTKISEKFIFRKCCLMHQLFERAEKYTLKKKYTVENTHVRMGL